MTTVRVRLFRERRKSQTERASPLGLRDKTFSNEVREGFTFLLFVFHSFIELRIADLLLICYHMTEEAMAWRSVQNANWTLIR